MHGNNKRAAVAASTQALRGIPVLRHVTRRCNVTQHGDSSESLSGRRDGRSFVVAMHGAARAMKLYPVEHQSVQRALRDLADIAAVLIDHDGELDVQISGDLLFVNGTRLRLDLANYTSVGHMLTLLRGGGVGSVKVANASTPRDWLVLLSLLDQARSAALGDATLD